VNWLYIVAACFFICVSYEPIFGALSFYQQFEFLSTIEKNSGQYISGLCLPTDDNDAGQKPTRKDEFVLSESTIKCSGYGTKKADEAFRWPRLL